MSTIVSIAVSVRSDFDWVLKSGDATIYIGAESVIEIIPKLREGNGLACCNFLKTNPKMGKDEFVGGVVKVNRWGQDLTIAFTIKLSSHLALVTSTIVALAA